MELLLSLDETLFLLLNAAPHNAAFDLLASILSGAGSAGIVWIAISLVIFIREERKDPWFFIPVAFATSLSWFLSELWLKSIFGRMRPTSDIGAIIVGDGAGNFSFPSSHATFSWALALVVAHKEPQYRGWFYLLAALISFSRIYIGVHYPGDILGGMLLGLAIGHASLALEKYVLAQKKQTRRRRKK